jgi:hypothetical protein
MADFTVRAFPIATDRRSLNGWQRVCGAALTWACAIDVKIAAKAPIHNTRMLND